MRGSYFAFQREARAAAREPGWWGRNAYVYGDAAFLTTIMRGRIGAAVGVACVAAPAALLV